MNNVYVDFHILQTVPPSCINRDDTGSPKTAMYGGVRRARVSSQCWKKATRDTFRKDFSEDQLGIRTKRLIKLITDEIMSIDNTVSLEDALQLAYKAVDGTTIKKREKKAQETKEAERKKKTPAEAREEESGALFFMSRVQAHNLAKYILDNRDANDAKIRKEATRLVKENNSVDIALFGRMVADVPTLNADAACQVAHAISTHRIENEYDYFTALDELKPAEEQGAAMIDTNEFNSSTLYRYANIAVHNLLNELNEEDVTADTVVKFAKAFITSMPTGKQTSYANVTLPNAVMITLRYDRPVNMVGAFEEPVYNMIDGGYVKNSIEKLNAYAKEMYSTYVDEPAKVWTIGMGEKNSLKDILSDLKTTLKENLNVEE